MDFEYRYQMRLACNVCGKPTIHVYYPSEVAFQGEWKCAACKTREAYSEGLADLAKIINTPKPADLPTST